MRIFLLIALTSATLNAFSQLDHSRKITLEVNEVSLEKLFDILESNYGIVIAFGTDNVPHKLKISVSVKDKTILDVVQIICTKTGLTYQIIDNAIVFKYTRHVIAPSRVKVLDSILSPNSIKDLPSMAVSAPVMIKDSVMNNPVDTLKEVADTAQTNTEVVQLESLIDPPSPVQEPSLFASDKKSKARIYGAGMFVSYAVDYNHFHFVERDIVFQKYKVDWNQSVSMGGYSIVSSKLYISLGVGYATKDFVLDYNYQVLDPDDPYPIPDQTKVKIRYLELPITVGYGIFSRRKFSLCIAAGFYPSFLIEENEHTTYLNAGDQTTSYFVSATRSTLYSGTIGFIAHYSISQSVGVFLEPGYLYFIGPVNNKAMENNSSLLRIKTGIQFSLFHKK